MFERFAIYVTPHGALGQTGAHWLGWDIATGQSVPHPALPGVDLAGLTAVPRKYGLHGTIKPPMVLAKSHTQADLSHTLATLCETLQPIQLAGLKVARLGQFLALVPTGDQAPLAAMAGKVVTQLDHFRAPPAVAELARRRQADLSPAQEENLARWGYPYVLDQFRFHITLTGPHDAAKAVQTVAADHFAPVLPAPFVIDHLTLAGQGSDGMFREIQRFPLGPGNLSHDQAPRIHLQSR